VSARSGSAAEILPADPEEHPAVQAWRGLSPRGFSVRRIEVLKSKPKRAAYRLMEDGRNGATVIAKRSEVPSARLERFIYQEVLTRLDLKSLSCHGLFEEPGGRRGWIFLEDARGEFYMPGRGEHRLLAGRWLAALHAAFEEYVPSGDLPGRGPDHYLTLLRSSRAALLQHRENPALLEGERSILDSIASRLAVVESRWDEVESFCATVPPTLVHGDLVVKNVRVRNGPAGPELLVFDWGNAGWGVPGTDLCQGTDSVLCPNLLCYCTNLDRRDRVFPLSRARRLALYGNVFRVLDMIAWAASGLQFGSRLYLLEPVSELGIYDLSLSAVLRAAGWNVSTGSRSGRS